MRKFHKLRKLNFRANGGPALWFYFHTRVPSLCDCFPLSPATMASKRKMEALVEKRKKEAEDKDSEPTKEKVEKSEGKGEDKPKKVSR